MLVLSLNCSCFVAVSTGAFDSTVKSKPRLILLYALRLGDPYISDGEDRIHVSSEFRWDEIDVNEEGLGEQELLGVRFGIDESTCASQEKFLCRIMR